MRQHRSVDSGGRESLARVRSSPAGLTDGEADIIAAIDIGTTYSGYSFGIVEDLNKDRTAMFINKTWISGNPRLTTMKAPTSVLFTPEKRFHSFGYEAEWKYSQLAADKVNGGWYYFRRFKMPLLSDENLNTTTSIIDDTGKPLRAAMIYGTVLKTLKSALVENLATSMKSCTVQWVTENFIFRWVITHPAGWSDDAKQFLRLAAKQASIPDIVLVPEPEAAAMYCHISNLHRINTRNGEIICIQKQGLHYLVVDLGGGTVDTTIHEFDDENKINELHSTCGAVFGGLRVDGAFVEFMMKVIGFEEMDKFAQSFRGDLLTLHKEFESKKRVFDPTSQDYISIKVPAILRRIYEVNAKQPLQLKVDNSEFGDLVKMHGDNINIDPEIFDDFFKSAGELILTHVMKVLSSKKGRNVKTIVMVGGFAQAASIQSLMRKKFPDMTILMPNEPELAVLKGAVLYGHEFAPIIKMDAKYSYGISIALPFHRHDHHEDKRFNANGVDLCTDIYSEQIRKGETVRIGDFVTKTSLFVNRKSQKFLSLPMFLHTGAESSVYTTDASCYFLGKMQISLASDRDLNAPIVVRMGLTYSELLVEVVDESNGRTVRDTFLDSPLKND
ncbi:heat shock 70 kDa protein 12A-like isoform X1 [Mizuhopecten yessoensis]|nr:heat shock 70 kDa protein 12A-like isoform X1 [Mizuhopecten yessoensis]XP_021363013.1 heat shock 70 kDa protein 12A-like isoform X1 [Mizuhopecten yessoensis]XP_021363014.1 heat shock 70 kDa protein 12A-like isoform X1 [Mizuhopecten yessoensis]